MSPLRHRWFKVKLHNYICRKCGARKTNVDDRGGFAAEWSTPDGRVFRGATPPCEPGPETPARLAWLAEHVLDHPTAVQA